MRKRIKNILVFTIILSLSSIQFYSLFKLYDKKQETEKVDISSCLDYDEDSNEDSNEDITDEVILFSKESKITVYFTYLLKCIDFSVNQRLTSLSIKIDSPPPNF